MTCSNPTRVRTIDSILRQFNTSTLEVMDKYRAESQKGKRDEELREVCNENKILLNYPDKAGKKVIDFINSYIHA